jgi:hypothetical protein
LTSRTDPVTVVPVGLRSSSLAHVRLQPQSVRGDTASSIPEPRVATVSGQPLQGRTRRNGRRNDWYGPRRGFDGDRRVRAVEARARALQIERAAAPDRRIASRTGRLIARRDGTVGHAVTLRSRAGDVLYVSAGSVQPAAVAGSTRTFAVG